MHSLQVNALGAKEQLQSREFEKNENTNWIAEYPEHYRYNKAENDSPSNSGLKLFRTKSFLLQPFVKGHILKVHKVTLLLKYFYEPYMHAVS